MRAFLIALMLVFNQAAFSPAHFQSLLAKRQLPNLAFDANAQKIDVSGPHAFQPPGPGDERGPCLGLNALANHNYLPHNGVATIEQFVAATTSVYGLGLDAALLLATYAAVLVGDVARWSVGGPSKAMTLGGLLSQPQGLSFSHNKLEADASLTRGDLSQTGDAAKLQVPLFRDLYTQLQRRGPGFKTLQAIDVKSETKTSDTVVRTRDILNALHAKRIAQSKAQNPSYFFAPFSGLLLSNGAYFFVYRLFGNKTAEQSEGTLTREVLKSFYAISGSGQNLVYTPGHERIPNNWYRRAIGDEYTILSVNQDLLRAILKFPQVAEVGGNTGRVNSFAGVDLSDLTGGVYNLQNLRRGNNAVCFALQAALSEVPDLVEGVVLDPIAALNSIMVTFNKVMSGLDCPVLSKYNTTAFLKFPGFTRSRRQETIG